MYVYEHHFVSITGSQLPLHRFRGQPLLLVNTATASHYARQLSKLQRLWENYRHCGLVVIGLPCNDFGGREPLEEAEVEQQCRVRFGISFPLTAKVRLAGQSLNPLFLNLQEDQGRDALPRWNFHKYLFDTRGRLAGHWPSRTEPDDTHVTNQIERNLQAWIL